MNTGSETNLAITECSQRKPYAFISYASDNWEDVFKSAVVPFQKRYGLRVYADKAFDKVNDKWIVPMLRNVRGADLMIAFVSQGYIESYACFLERCIEKLKKNRLALQSFFSRFYPLFAAPALNRPTTCSPYRPASWGRYSA